MSLRKVSMVPYAAWAFAILAVAVIIYDTWAATTGGQAQTLSGFIQAVSARHPILPFSMGVLIGHLLWPGG